MARILVADDQESMRLIISGMLEENGHTVVTAEDGLAAFEKFKNDSFDLLVADVNMPGLNGIEFLRKVKAEKPQTKIIFVTGMLEAAVKVGAEKFGLDGLILKPFDKKEALEIIGKVLNRE
jgi:CheY-like chemotaxis protein